MRVRRVVGFEKEVSSFCSGHLGEFSMEGGAQNGSEAWDGDKEQGWVLGWKNYRQ